MPLLDLQQHLKMELEGNPFLEMIETDLQDETELEEDGKEQYSSMLEKAKKQIGAEKQKALSEIKTTVVDIAIKASEKVIKRNLNNEDNKKLVEQTVDEFKQAN